MASNEWMSGGGGAGVGTDDEGDADSAVGTQPRKEVCMQSGLRPETGPKIIPEFIHKIRHEMSSGIRPRNR